MKSKYKLAIGLDTTELQGQIKEIRKIFSHKPTRLLTLAQAGKIISEIEDAEIYDLLVKELKRELRGKKSKYNALLMQQKGDICSCQEYGIESCFLHSKEPEPNVSS